MALNAALEGELGELHKQLTDRLKTHIRDPKCDPRYIQMAIKFLADNKIYQNAEPGNDISELSKDLQKRKKRFNKENITDIATAQAKKEAEG